MTRIRGRNYEGLFSLQEGRKITPKDPEEFQLKQEFVRRVTEKVSLKAEEEAQTTTTTTAATASSVAAVTAMTLDFVRRPVIK